MTPSPYQTQTMRIAASREEAPDVRTLRLEFTDAADRARFFEKYRAGMFGIYGVPGAGECAFCIASPPTHTDFLECTFRRTGRVTSALADREVGQTITFRGPYGNAFPIESWKGRRLVFVAGGIGLPAMRGVLWNVLQRRREFGDITLVYGARTPADLVYKDELADWAARPQVQVVTTVDPGGESAEWKGRVGLVPTVLEELAPPGAGAAAAVCGPPVMIKFTMPVLTKLGFAPDAVCTTLENRMKCGIGHCGRCNVGGTYVCRDGPVFTLAQLKSMLTADS